MKEFEGGIPFPLEAEPWEKRIEQYKVLDFLSEISQISDREISEFCENRIVPLMKNAFEKASLSEKIILVAIDRLPEGKFNTLMEIANSECTHLMAIHDAKNTFLSLRMLTQDDRYRLRN